MSSMVDVKHTEQCNFMGPCDTITPSVLLIPLSACQYSRTWVCHTLFGWERSAYFWIDRLPWFTRIGYQLCVTPFSCDASLVYMSELLRICSLSIQLCSSFDCRALRIPHLKSKTCCPFFLSFFLSFFPVLLLLSGIPRPVKLVAFTNLDNHCM